MCSVVGKPMAQDIPIPEQDIVIGEQEPPPQMDPKPEMGAAAAEAAAYDTSPPPLRQNPPIRLEQSVVDVILQAINGMNNKMDGMAQTMREEMQCIPSRAYRGD